MPLRSAHRAYLHIVAAILLFLSGGVAQAEIPLRDLLVEARTSTEMPHSFNVGRYTNSDDWTWLSLSRPYVLAKLPAGWRLLVDQCRFKRMAVMVTTRDGRVLRIQREAGELQNDAMPGGLLQFPISVEGNNVRGLQIGFEDIDDIGLMRRVSAEVPSGAIELSSRWLVLMGVFAGVMLSALVYNAFLHAGHRLPFLRWYLAWLAAALAYGMTWTNVAALLIPSVAGPAAVRMDYILVGLVIGLASFFLLSVLEEGKVSPRLRTLVAGFASFSIVGGLLASDERVLFAPATDKLFNVVLLLCVLATVAGIATAVRRGSRVVWLYLLGWTPILIVFALRSARNFGVVEQNDLTDMATFGAIGFESLMFSLAMASRFKALRLERDANARLLDSARVEAETLQRLARSDVLTGLGNRAAFNCKLEQLYESRKEFVLYLIDADYLKEVNDRVGHSAGDRLLQLIATHLSRLAGDETFVSRIGGDEFAILAFGNQYDQDRVADLIDAIQGEAWVFEGARGALSLSIGSAVAAQARDSTELFKQADMALYEAKTNGKGQLRKFDARLASLSEARSQLAADAHRGLADDEFCLFYQPVVDLRTGSVVSEEALLRWKHPLKGLLPASNFSELFVENEIGRALQARVLDLVIADLKQRTTRCIPVAINLTGSDLRGASSARRLLARLNSERIAPHRLCIEVTERVLLEQASGAPSIALAMLRDAGMTIALDDFGTGYASLVHLRQLAVDTLKIDKAFVADLLEQSETEQIVNAVIALAHGLGKSVIAEGVEHEAQAERLRELGCDYAQGFYFGQPGTCRADSEPGSIAVA